MVKLLEHVDLFGIDEDLNGRLFETFLNATMRGRVLGQFFTPRSIVKVMTRMAGLRAERDHRDKVIDACCGTGGFLIEAFSEMRNIVRENDSLSDGEKSNLIESIANDCIYGIDFGKDPPLARIARINMYLHGDGGSHIYYADALDKEVDATMHSDPEVTQNLNELRVALANEQFDVVLTNPPFSMAKEAKNPQEKTVLKQYDIALRNPNSMAIRPSLRSSVMFFERYWDMLKPGGKLITVIDDTILSSSNFKFVRDFIRQRFLVRAIISLPGDSFKMSESRVKTSVLNLEKRRSPTEEQPNWFHFFSLQLGIDDQPTRRSDHEVREARKRAENEIDTIISEYNRYLGGEITPYVLGPEHLDDSFALRNCVPLFGRMESAWLKMGLEVEKLMNLVVPANQVLSPSDFPNREFLLFEVSYDGYCKAPSRKLGSRIKPKSMQIARSGQLICSVYNAHNGACAIVPPDLEGALVSTTSYMLFDGLPSIGSSEDMAYLWSVLRSSELRADIQSLSVGSGRYTVKWPVFGQLLVPLESKERRHSIGKGILGLWEAERNLETLRNNSVAHLDSLGVESDQSKERWAASKAPQ